MRINKAAFATGDVKVTAEDLLKINTFTGRELSEEDVFVFSIKLCDNETDRDSECFSAECLKTLAELFVGKTGISDHTWSSDRQVARIFDTEVITEKGVFTQLGEPYTYVKARAYTLKTAGNEEFIAKIEGGITKEVSVGCAVSSCVCSICGNALGSAECGHIRGAEYGNKKCVGILDGAADAYEWSFVAVPAQKNAGVMKSFIGAEPKTLKALAESCGNTMLAKELCTLEKQAETGRRYLELLRKDALRLGAITELWEPESLNEAVKNMDETSLLSLIKSLEKKADEIYPPTVQLKAYAGAQRKTQEEYMI